MPNVHLRAFTLIELSIVLVIIGLIVGGVLAGRDLIRSAEVRATITQIEKYNTAANTFRGKYGYLPGDIKDPDASSFGFQPRGTQIGQGDGDGILESNIYYDNTDSGYTQLVGETAVFWVDLGAAHLIDDTLTTAQSAGYAPIISTASGLAAYFPAAKMGNGNFVYAFSNASVNYFGVAVITSSDGYINVTAGMTVQQAYAIDSKIDDGKPEYGRVQAQGVEGSVLGWAAGGSFNNNAAWTAIPASPTSCFDNNNTYPNPHYYSVEYQNGANVNCALTFQFQ